MNFCTNCGEKLIKGKEFCPNCGTPVVNDQNNHLNTESRTENTELNESEKKPKKSLWKKIGLVIVGIFGIFFLINFTIGFIDGFTSAFKDDIIVEVEIGLYDSLQDSRKHKVKEGTKLIKLISEEYEITENHNNVIDSINGIQAGVGDVWFFYINGDTPQVAWEEYVVRDGDLITLNLE